MTYHEFNTNKQRFETIEEQEIDIENIRIARNTLKKEEYLRLFSLCLDIESNFNGSLEYEENYEFLNQCEKNLVQCRKTGEILNH